MKKKPNILIFNPDEMRWDAMGHMGNKAACTPRLDSFAANDAVSFRNAYCQNPVCVPSRCSLFTGLYPHTTGHRTMGYLMREHETSLLKELKDAGYYVWANARNDLVAAEFPGLIESHVTEMYYGGNVDPAPGAEAENPRGDMDDPRFYSFCNGKLKIDEKGKNYTSDDEDVDAAIERIQHPISDKPFCMFIGLLYPHPPYNIEEPYFSAIDRGKLPHRIRAEETSGKTSMHERLQKFQNVAGMTKGQWDELRAIYLAMCAKVDEQFGKICDALKEAGEYDNTAIFFLSDHGDYAGDYDIVEKTQNCFEDCLTRVPLLIKPPKGYTVDPGITDSFAELIDFYATAMEIADVKPSHSHFGRSLLPVLEDRKREVRDRVFCEGGRMAEEVHCSEAVDPDIYDGFHNSTMWPRYAAQYDGTAHAKGVMVRDKRWKYIYRAHGKCELYHISEDPYELHNVVDEPENRQLIMDMKCAALEWYQDTCDIVPFEKDIRFNEKMIWEKVKCLCPDGYEDEVKEKIRSTNNLFLVKDYCAKLNGRKEQ